MSVDWYKATENDLREYSGLLDSVTSLQERINILEASMTSLKGASLDNVPIHGGGSRGENHTLNCMVEIDEKKRLLKINWQKVKEIERGLKALNNDERKVVEGFYIYPLSNHRCADVLAEEMHCDRSTVYDIRTRALRKLVLHTHGLPKT